MKELTFTYIIFILTASSCGDDSVTTACGSSVITSEEYETIQSDPFTIASAQIIDNCITIEISAGGCDGTTWLAELYKSTEEGLSVPPELFMKIILDDDEECDAIIRRTFNYDMSSLIAEQEQFIIRLEGWDHLLEFPVSDINPDSSI